MSSLLSGHYMNGLFISSAWMYLPLYCSPLMDVLAGACNCMLFPKKSQCISFMRWLMYSALSDHLYICVAFTWIVGRDGWPFLHLSITTLEILKWVRVIAFCSVRNEQCAIENQLKEICSRPCVLYVNHYMKVLLLSYSIHISYTAPWPPKWARKQNKTL